MVQCLSTQIFSFSCLCIRVVSVRTKRVRKLCKADLSASLVRTIRCRLRDGNHSLSDAHTRTTTERIVQLLMTVGVKGPFLIEMLFPRRIDPIFDSLLVSLSFAATIFPYSDPKLALKIRVCGLLTQLCETVSCPPPPSSFSHPSSLLLRLFCRALRSRKICTLSSWIQF